MKIVVFAGVGLLLIAISSPSRQTIFAPGPLSQPHAQILSTRLQNDRCAMCHPIAESAFANWFASGSVGHENVTQSDLCMNCHHAVIDEKVAIQPHNLEHDLLVSISRRIQQSSGTNRIANFGSVECAVCHREHHGEDFDLTKMTNNQCQSCHSNTFHSFADGHPEWKNWPYGRGGELAFDHGSHEFEHFTKQGQAFDCRSCHSIDNQGVIARAGSFESMCASCHDEPLELKVAEGFALLGLPTLDGEAIIDQGLVMGAWPTVANGVDRFQIPVLTRMLLSRDPVVAAAIERLEDPSLNSMDQLPSPETVSAMKQVADSLKQLLQTLARDPDVVLKTIFADENASAVLGQLSPQLLRGAQRDWFSTPGELSIDESPFDPVASLPRGGWYQNNLTSTIQYHGSGHSDTLLRSLVELAGTSGLDAADRERLLAIPVVVSCLECHPKGTDASWKAVRSNVGQRTFTKFSHQPHLNLAQLQDCKYCHQSRSARDQNDLNLTSTRLDPYRREYDFEPLRKSACVECHVPKAAGDSCLKCHNYHIKAE